MKDMVIGRHVNRRIDKEWLKLKSTLTEDQLSDARRIFFCGALFILSEFAEGKLTTEFLINAYYEVEKVLKYEDEGPDAA